MSASLSASLSVSICHPSDVFYPCFLALPLTPPNTVCLSLIVPWRTRDQRQGTKWHGHFGIQSEVLRGKQIDVIFLNANVLRQCFLWCLFLLLYPPRPPEQRVVLHLRRLNNTSGEKASELYEKKSRRLSLPCDLIRRTSTREQAVANGSLVGICYPLWSS